MGTVSGEVAGVNSWGARYAEQVTRTEGWARRVRHLTGIGESVADVTAVVVEAMLGVREHTGIERREQIAGLAVRAWRGRRRLARAVHVEPDPDYWKVSDNYFGY